MPGFFIEKKPENVMMNAEGASMQSTEDKHDQYDKLEDKMKASSHKLNKHKVSNKSIFNLAKIIKEKSQDEQKS